MRQKPEHPESTSERALFPLDIAARGHAGLIGIRRCTGFCPFALASVPVTLKLLRKFRSFHHWLAVAPSPMNVGLLTATRGKTKANRQSR